MGMVTMSDAKRIRQEREERRRLVGASRALDTQRRLWEVIPDGLWRNRRAFIIGGGPSLANFDWSILKGELVIGINRAYEKCDPVITLSMDSRLWAWIEKGKFGPESLRRFESCAGFKCWVNTIRFPYPPDLLTLDCAGRDEFPLSMTLGVGTGGNSGYAALNLAVCLRANPVYLLGYDMRGDGKGRQKWWHNGYPTVQNEDVYKRFRQAIENAADRAKAISQIINLNPDSALRCFEFGSIEDIQPIDRPVVVSYFTEGTGYSEEAKKLALSVRRFGLETDIVGVPSLGSWELNTQHKPAFLLRMLGAHPRRALLWIDADAQLREYPVLFDNLCDVDIAAHHRQKRDRRELLSGTIYLRDTAATRCLLVRWRDECAADPQVWDQRVLQSLIENEFDGKFMELPASYCCIYDTMASTVSTPVIEHFQASRHLKKVVNG